MRNSFNYIQKAHDSLKSRWLVVLPVYIIYHIGSYILDLLEIKNLGLYFFASFFITVFFIIGLKYFNILIAQRKEVSLHCLFDFIPYFLKTIVLFLAINICIVVGLVAFIIPGIIISIYVSQVFYIMAEDPKKDVISIMKESFQMMEGSRLEYFYLSLLFVPVIILGYFTYGLTMIIVAPYFGIATAHFYLEKSKVYKSKKEENDAEN